MVFIYRTRSKDAILDMNSVHDAKSRDIYQASVAKTHKKIFKVNMPAVKSTNLLLSTS